MHLRRRLTLGVPEILGQLDDAYALADNAPESPRRRTLVELLGNAIGLIESAAEDWDRVAPGSTVRAKLSAALESLVLVDLLAEVVVRDGDGGVSPTADELLLHDRVRETTAAVRPALVMAEDAAADAAMWDSVGDESSDDRQSRSDTLLDLMLAVGQIREWFEQRSGARLPAHPAARETAMLGVTLARHCLDRSVAALEALSDGDAEAAARDLRAAESALVVCEERLPDDVATLRPPIADVLHSLER
jgi:hypothetical protein